MLYKSSAAFGSAYQEIARPFPPQETTNSPYAYLPLRRAVVINFYGPSQTGSHTLGEQM